MKHSGLNDNQVTNQLGLSVGLLGKSRREGSDLGKKTIEKILQTYTDLNYVWLMTGHGEMLYEPETTRILNELPMVSEPIAEYSKVSQRKDDRESKLLDIIKSQQETIKTLSETIKNLTSK